MIRIHMPVRIFLMVCLTVSLPAILFLELVLRMIGAPHVSQD